MTTPIHRYTVYGMPIEANAPVRHLNTSDEPAVATNHDILAQPLQITYQGLTTPQLTPPDGEILYSSPAQTKEGRGFFEVWKHAGGLWLCHHNHNTDDSGVRAAYFDVDPSGHTLDISWTAAFNVDDLSGYLLGPVLGCILRTRRVTPLHASVLNIGEKAIIVTGAKGAGKSTLAAFFARNGHRVLADDIASLVRRENSYWVHPGYPHLRLWRETLDELGCRDALPPVSVGIDKRYLALTGSADQATAGFQRKALPLAGIFVLENFNASCSVSITPLVRAEGLINLVRNTYADYLLDATGRGRDFDFLTGLLADTAVYKVSRPRDLALLPEVIEAIVGIC